MKVRIARASNPVEEKVVNMLWAGQFADELLGLIKEMPLTEENSESWEKKDDEEYSFIVSVNKTTRNVEIMLYDYYVE